MKRFANMIALWLIAWVPPSYATRAADRMLARGLPICTVLKNSQSYDGKMLLIQGLYRWEPHGAVFMGYGSCANEVIRLRLTKDYRENKTAKSILDSLIKKNNAGPVHVIYRGTFRVIHGLLCSEVHCFRFEIEASELVAARSTRDVGHWAD